MRSPKIALALCVILFSGCDVEHSETAEKNSSVSDRAVSQPVAEQRISNPFPNASELRLYVETSYDKGSGQPVFHRVNGVRLTADQRKAFEDALKIEAAPEAMAACFIPHHFFRYFDANGNQIGEVSVCFCCNGVAASGSEKLIARNGEIISANYAAVESVVAALGEPTDVLCD